MLFKFAVDREVVEGLAIAVVPVARAGFGRRSKTDYIFYFNFG
jgi:hypothetical protein